MLNKMLEAVKDGVGEEIAKLTREELEKWFTRVRFLAGQPEVFAQCGGEKEYAEAVRVLGVLGAEKLTRLQDEILAAAAKVMEAEIE